MTIADISGSIVSTSVSESTTAILSLESSTGSDTSTLDTTTETSKVETGTTTTLVSSTTATSEVEVTTTETESSTKLATSTATTDATTSGQTTTTTADITTTTEAETTTTEAGCPRVTVLANPTPIFVSDPDGVVYDDTYKAVQVPFSVGVFGASSSTVYVSVNGFLSLFDSGGYFTNRDLPTEGAPRVAIMPYWDDLFVNSGGLCGVGINYEVYETERGQTFTVEYYVAGSQGDDHFTVSLYKDYPGLLRYVYYATAGHGNSATVGAQNLQNGQQLFFEYSYNTPTILDNSFLEITTSTEGIALVSGQL